MAQKKQIIIPAPTGGLSSYLPDTQIEDNKLALAENVVFMGNAIRKCPGTATAVSTISSPASVEPRQAYTFKTSTGTEIPIVYERGKSSSLTKRIYHASISGTTWTWAAMTQVWDGAGTTLVLTDSRTPRFITARGKLFFSNGDYDASGTDGLIFWSGTGDADHVHRAGTQNGISTRFLTYFKERLVGAYGYYCKGGTWSSEYTSGIFYSSITDSSGNPVDPDDPDAWHEVDTTFNEIEPRDGSWITAIWVWMGNIYVAKETGIWVMYGEPKNFDIRKVSQIGMKSDNSLQLFENRYIFLNNDGWFQFDGQSNATHIDDDIKNYIPYIPQYDLD